MSKIFSPHQKKPMGNHKLKIGFRVDAGNVVGTGHLTEVISLIKSIRKRIPFTPVVITKYNPFTLERLKQINVNVIKYIPDDISEKGEADEIITILKKENCRHLVIDLLNRSNEFYDFLNDNFKSTCVILDNSEHKEIPASIVVNFSITQDPEFYKKASKYNTKYLIGPEYFPLDESITKIILRERKDKVERIFVNQGGGDPYGLTIKIINALEMVNSEQIIDVVIGGAWIPEHIKELEKVKVNLIGRYNFYCDILHEEVFNIMAKADIALTAPGNTLYELAYLGIPSIVISHHKRHYEVARAFEREQAIINLGIGSDILKEDIYKGVKKIIRDEGLRGLLSQNIRKLIDGDGLNRLIDHLIKAF